MGSILALSLACSGLPMGTPADKEIAVEPVEGVAPEPEPEPVTVAWPEDPFTDVDGFVGVAINAEATDWWVPHVSLGEGVPAVLVVGNGFADVAKGATFIAVHAGGNTAVTFAGVQSVDWGCAKADAAVFTPAEAVGPGLVWIAATADGLSARKVEERREPSRSWRLFRLPNGAEFDVKPGRTVIEQVGGRPWVNPWSGAGADLLQGDKEGPHWPELVVTDGNGVLVLMRTHTGGFAWEVLRIAGKEGKLLGRQSAGISACGAS